MYLLSLCNPSTATRPTTTIYAMATSMFTAIIDSILPSKPQPVVPDSQLLKAMDISFCGLILTLAALAFITSANPHVLALILVAVCLWLSVRWLVDPLLKP